MKIFAFFLPVPFPLPIIIHKETLPLHVPVYEESIFDLIKKGNLKAVHSSIEKGTGINSKNFKGETLVHYAVYHNQIDIAKLLIRLGANLYSTDNTEQTVIDLIHNRHQEVLLDNNQVNELGVTTDLYCDII